MEWANRVFFSFKFDTDYLPINYMLYHIKIKHKDFLTHSRLFDFQIIQLMEFNTRAVQISIGYQKLPILAYFEDIGIGQ